jgi:protein ImuA
MIAEPIQNTPKPTIVELRNQLRKWERHFPQAQTACISTGCDALDALFPRHGIQQGSLVEWVGDASGAETLSLLVGRRFCTTERPAVLVDFQQQIYPVALSALGFDLSKLVIVHPNSERETLWACEEVLRCKAIAVLWAKIEHLSNIAFRRLQLAVEESGVVGFLVRSTTALKQSSWADVRLLVTPRPAYHQSPCVRVSVAYSHGKTMQSETDIEIDALRGTLHGVSFQNQTHRMSLAS